MAPFVLRGVRWEGAAREPSPALRPVLRRFLGRRLDAAGLKALVEATSARYARSDVALYAVEAPAQDFARGVVRLRVVEGHVEAVEVRAGDARLAARLRTYARPVLAERPLRRSTLERALGLMRALPGVTAVDATVVGGAREGAVRLVLTAHRRRVAAAAQVRDRGAARLGRVQVSAELTVHALLGAGDRTSLAVGGSAGSSRFRAVSLVHAQTVGSAGVTLQASVGWFATRPLGSAIEGSARLGGLQLAYPVESGARRSVTLTAGIDAIDSTDALFGATFSDERTRTLRAGVLILLSPGPDAAFSLGATASQGVRGLGSRPVAPGWSDAGFRKLSVQVAAAKGFGAWTVRLRGTAQATPDRLPASELLALGGDDFGRGFEAGVATGDEGAAVSLEAAWAAAQALAPGAGGSPLSRAMASSEVYGFADAGRTRLKSRPQDGLPGETSDLASAGVGARVSLADRAMLQIEASRRLVSRLPTGEGPGGKGDWRLVLGVRITS